MSFSSDIKKSLSAAEIKRDCCRAAYESGLGLLRFSPVCERDAAHYLRGVFVRCGSVSAPGRNFMLSLSLPPETEFIFVKATFTKRDCDDRSPGSPMAPMPRLYV